MPMLQLLGGDLEIISSMVAEKVGFAPDFFRNTPVVIELQELAKKELELDFSKLIPMLKQYGMNPIGVRGGNQSLNNCAKSMDLAVLADSRSEQKTEPVKPVSQPKSRPVHEPVNDARLVTQPVRSGQKVYAAGSDLIVIAQVSHGAELMADGNIHVYGTLRGRALAGVKGNLESRIFAQNLKAELVSVAGHYKISENLDESLSGKPVQVFLHDEVLIVEPI